jgi:hypothetical protein
MSHGLFVASQLTSLDAVQDNSTITEDVLTPALGEPMLVAQTAMAVMAIVFLALKPFGIALIQDTMPDGPTLVDGVLLAAVGTVSLVHTPVVTTFTLQSYTSETVTTVSRSISCSEPSTHGITKDSSFVSTVVMSSKKDLASTEDQEVAFAVLVGLTKLILFPSVSTTLLKL